LACLHQIRLYFHYILEDQFADANVHVPSKLDYRCVDLSFREMRLEGFADDGLFDQMKKFFLPLTTVEQDLEVPDAHCAGILARRRDDQERLEQERVHLICHLKKIEDQYYRLDERIVNTERNLNTSRDNNPAGDVFEREISEYRQNREQLELRRNELLSRLSVLTDMLENIGKALKDGIRGRNSRDLIKPNRSFIMYGPPGK